MEYTLFNHFLWGRGEKEMKKEIDIIFDDQKVKEKYFKHRILLQATKSWAKKDVHIVQNINRIIDDVGNLRKKISEFIKDRIYRFRNIEFDMVDILLCFITEYVYYLCKYYIGYMNKKEINKFIKDLFPHKCFV